MTKTEQNEQSCEHIEATGIAIGVQSNGELEQRDQSDSTCFRNASGKAIFKFFAKNKAIN